MYDKIIKRLLDIVFSLVSLIVLGPLLLVLALLVRIKLGKPVVFKQARPGKNERIFFLYKFRSMTNETDSDGRLLPDAQRLTKFGKFLRVSSADELLELFNILKGDMSFVGPRPLSIHYLPYYAEPYRARHDVRPGLTGIAQVMGRNSLAWDERFAYDLQYIRDESFFYDLKIIFMTIRKVLKRENVSVRGTGVIKDYGSYCILKEEGNNGMQNNKMSYSEIGSYFWLDDSKNNKDTRRNLTWLPSAEDATFTFSGRAAIYLALSDILKTTSCKKAYLPVYCCVSMLQPFLDLEIPVEFYTVRCENGNIVCDLPDAEKDTVVLIMNYFGVQYEETAHAIEKLHRQGTIIIEDITHSLLSERSKSVPCDYMVASLRKWFAVPTGGWIGKTKGMLQVKPLLESGHFTASKIDAMHA
ncbi:MAG: sugar transferase, partial [Ruminococcus sp.]|nr:sugar transferase [Ruminococcus sp.]